MPTWTGNAFPDPNWSNAGNWDTGVPTAATPAIFNGVGANGNNNVTITAGATCSLINFTGYSGELNMAVNLTVAGAVTLSASMASTGTGNISKTGSGTMTSNGHVFSGGILMSAGSLTLTWADNWNILNYTGTILGPTIWSGAFIVSVRQDAVVRAILSVVGNITTLRMSGTGFLSSISNGGNPTASSPGVNINIDTAGTVTMAGSFLICNSTFTYTQGNFDPAAITFNFGLGTTFDTDRTGGGGGKITFNNVARTSSGTGNITLTTNLWMSGSLTNPVGATTFIGSGRTIYVGTNLASAFFGDITIELNTSTNGSILTGGHGTNITINKTVGASVSLGNLTLSTSGRTLTYTNGVINPLTSTVTITTSTSITVNGWTFWDLTIGSGVTLTQNAVNTIQNGLSLSGSATFVGTQGWITKNFTHAGAGFVCTLKAGNTYVVNGIFTMIGTPSSRAVIQSNDAVAVTVSIPASPSLLMTVNVGSIPSPAAGYVLGSTSTALPSILNNLLPDRPTIDYGTASPYTLVDPIGALPLTLFAGTVGKKAFLRVTNGSGSTNVSHVTTRDIDSNGGITILAFGSYSDEIGKPSANLFRTLNWGPLIAPSGSVYYTFVS
jgi:hypothetical protein